ncbi:MAG: hypothetical protein HQM09_21770 [Candidatus Riflebacteria bacterium]|nr:hypothetical protein [Candidatus Riflebacteria bacterium]
MSDNPVTNTSTPQQSAHPASATEGVSQKVNACANLISAFSKFIWAVIVLIILANVGRYLATESPKVPDKIPTTIIVQQPIPWPEIDAEIVKSCRLARSEAEEIATKKVSAFISEMTEKVDNDFLEWYFGYWTQQKLGLKGIMYSVEHWWNDKANLSAAEQITYDVQVEFAARVLRPQIAQMQLENISKAMVEKYLVSLNSGLNNIPAKFNIPQAAWQKYLEDLSQTTTSVPGNRDVDLPIKTIAMSTAAGTVVAAKSLITIIKPMIAKIGSKVAVKGTAEAVTAMAAKTGAKVATKLEATAMLGTIIGIGIVIWDVYDHASTKATEKPILRKNIMDYFEELRKSLIYDPETGLMQIVNTIESQVLSNVRK